MFSDTVVLTTRESILATDPAMLPPAMLPAETERLVI